MRERPIFIFVVVFIKLSISREVPQYKDEWLSYTGDGLKRLELLAEIKERWNIDFSEPTAPEVVLKRLKEWLPFYENFLVNSQLNETSYRVALHVFEDELSSIIDDSLTAAVEAGLLNSVSLKQKYDSTFLPLMRALKEDVADKIQSDPFAHGGYMLPLETACSTLPFRNVPKISVRDVCPTVSRCARSFHSSNANACTKTFECDVRKAIPLMVGLFFYKVSFAFVDKLCSGRCSGDGGCNTKKEFSSIVREVDLVKAFISMIPEKPFDEFYRDALKKRAYSEIGPAMQIISKNDDIFSSANLACKELEAEPACGVMTFYPNYLLLRKIKEERLHPRDTRDLTLHENVDHAKIIQLKKEAIKHIELLSAIQQLDSNLQAQVRGIASYFKGIASFDQDVADADVVFIDGKLKDFDMKFTNLSAKVNDDVEKTMIAMTTLLGVQLVEDTIALVSKIVAESNPIKAIFSGVDEKGVREQAVKVANTAANLAHGISLFAHLGGLATDTSEIGTDLHDNQQQLGKLLTLVNKIKNNQVDQLDNDADTFIQQYANYTPKVDRSRLAQNTAMWGAFKESTCNLLNGVEGIGASVGKGVANGFLLCENLEGTIAEFDALRENIFDFQFELVDSLARVARGNVAGKLADSIQEQERDMFRADQLLGGFLMTQIFLQTQAWLYCDKLQYKNEGRRVQPCSPEAGLFANSDLDNLAAFTDHQTYISVERTVHIPTKPQFRGDLGFINIHTFAKEKTASFRLPLNQTWLHRFDWKLIGETQAPYVENLELFLPNKQYQTGAQKIKTSTRIVVSADTDTGSYVSADRENYVLYKLPEKQTSFVTVYQEGYRSSTCSKEIPNPYSLCNNLPNMCHTSTNVAGDSLLPTILSRWRITYTLQSGEEELDWLAPNSYTDLNLIAKVKLRMLPGRTANIRKSTISMTPDDVCCQGNTYRQSLVTSECKDCPSGSTKALGGYYCEVDKV